MENKEVLLELKDAQTYFPIKAGVLRKPTKFVKTVNDIDLTIYRGEILGLVGGSGYGKITFGKSILQLVKPTGGEVIYDFKRGVGKKDLGKLNTKEMDLAYRKMQIVFQDPHSSLNPALTIYRSLSNPLKKFGVKDKKDRGMIIGDILEAVNMRREYTDRYPYEFSDGQRQRIGIARASCVNPELIIYDESISALNVSIQAQALNLLKKIKEERNLTYILIAYDLSVVEYISDRIAVIYLGRIIEPIETSQIFSDSLHPYTGALLSTIPTADLDHKRKRTVLEGDVPSPVDPPEGCNPHPRCRKCMDICEKERPLLKKHIVDGEEHYAACHLAEMNIKENNDE